MKKTYISGFEGIRALGVIGVILYHLFPNQVQGGYLGVSLFFVLSGYLITDLLVQEYSRTGKIDIKSFYLRRLKRLYPLLLTVLLTVALYLFLFQPNMLNQMGMTFLASVLSFFNWWQIAKGGSYFAQLIAEAPFQHIYSLAIEAQFYLVYPLVMAFGLKHFRRKWELGLIFLILSLLSALGMALLFKEGQDPTRVYYGTDTRLFSILIGSSLALFLPSQALDFPQLARRDRWLITANLLALSALLLQLFWLLPDQAPITYQGAMLAFSLLSGLLIVGVILPQSPFGKWLSNPIFTYLGTRSYGLYLWQMPVLTLVSLKISQPHSLKGLAIQLGILLILTELGYQLVEKPCRRLTWKTLKNRWQTFFKTPATVKKAGQILLADSLILVTLLALAVIATAPDKSGAQAAITDTIQANQEKLEAAKAAQTPASPQIQLVMDKYGVSQEVATAASQDNAALLGDSMFVMVYDNLREAFPAAYIDGIIGRRKEHIVPLLDLVLQEQATASKFIVSIGINTDGTSFLDRETLDQFMALADDRPVYWLTINLEKSHYYWTQEVNDVLRQAAVDYPNFHLVDWYQASQGQEESLLAEDMTHPNDAGAVAYVKTILTTVYGGQ